MSEFDFDELDKAVNALMDKTTPESKPVAPASEDMSASSPEPPQAANVPVASDQPQTPPIAMAPVQDTVVPEPVSQAAVPVAPPVRRGRFMDMKPQNSGSGPEIMPTRSKASVIAPLSTAGLEPAAVPTRSRLVRDILPPNTVQPPVTEAVKPTPPEKPAAQPSAEPGWPDPISTTPAASDSNSRPEQTAPSPVPDQVTKGADSGSSPLEVAKPPEFKPDFPLFVPDAKVDKRPLGGTNQGVDEKAASPGNEATEPIIGETSQELPPELGQDILSVESKDTSELSIESKQETKPESQSDHILEASDTAAQPIGAVSIPQQYKEAPNTGDESHTALYETASYAPLQHPSKKKSGWLVVLIIVILLIVFGGGAAALYYLHIL